MNIADFRGIYSQLSETFKKLYKVPFSRDLSPPMCQMRHRSTGVCLWTKKNDKMGQRNFGADTKSNLQLFFFPNCFLSLDESAILHTPYFFSPLFPPNCGVSKGRIAFPDMNAQWFSPQKKRKKKKGVENGVLCRGHTKQQHIGEV